LNGQEGFLPEFLPIGVFAHRPALGRKPEFGVEGKVLEVVSRKVAARRREHHLGGRMPSSRRPGTSGTTHCCCTARPTLAVTNCAQTFDHPASAISDHYGLVADLTLPPQSPKNSRQPSN
jgi:hypothetical protein